MSWLTWAMGLFVYAPAVAGAVYFIGYFLLALSVGHTKILSWLSSAIDVDAAPPEMFCKLKVYTALDTLTSGLRHGLYDYEEVIAGIGTIAFELTGQK